MAGACGASGESARFTRKEERAGNSARLRAFADVWRIGETPDMSRDSAVEIAGEQLKWYRSHKTKARWGHYLLELVAVALSFLVTIAGILRWDAKVAAIAGGILVLLAGLRAEFQLRENWIGWNAAEAEVQKAMDYYGTEIEPYDGPDRDQQLVRRVWEVRMSETQAWKSRKSPPPPPTSQESSASSGRRAAGSGSPPSELGE